MSVKGTLLNCSGFLNQSVKNHTVMVLIILSINPSLHIVFDKEQTENRPITFHTSIVKH